MQEYPSALPLSEQTRFRRVLARVNPASIEQLDYRRERQVYLLTNGKRTIGQISGLLGITSSEVARMMKRMVEQGYVEFVLFDEDQMRKIR
jgi:DNA-binding MarR family transcriptional regulator